jgi:hypothetical protein
MKVIALRPLHFQAIKNLPALYDLFLDPATSLIQASYWQTTTPTRRSHRKIKLQEWRIDILVSSVPAARF